MTLFFEYSDRVHINIVVVVVGVVQGSKARFSTFKEIFLKMFHNIYIPVQFLKIRLYQLVIWRRTKILRINIKIIFGGNNFRKVLVFWAVLEISNKYSRICISLPQVISKISNSKSSKWKLTLIIHKHSTRTLDSTLKTPYKFRSTISFIIQTKFIQFFSLTNLICFSVLKRIHCKKNIFETKKCVGGFINFGSFLVLIAA